LSLVTFLRDFPVKEPYFQFRGPFEQCRASFQLDHKQCLVINGKPSLWREVVGTIETNGSRVEVPLYVIAPSPNVRLLPIYGMAVKERTKASTYSIEKVRNAGPPIPIR
jgi:hypothetical protein